MEPDTYKGIQQKQKMRETTGTIFRECPDLYWEMVFCLRSICKLFSQNNVIVMLTCDPSPLFITSCNCITIIFNCSSNFGMCMLTTQDIEIYVPNFYKPSNIMIGSMRQHLYWLLPIVLAQGDYLSCTMIFDLL